MTGRALKSGAQVFLRHPHVGDAEVFLALRRESRALHAPWEPLPMGGVDPLSLDAFTNFLAGADTPTSQRHLVCRRADSALVGYVGLSQIVMGAFCSCYMGYWTGAPFVGRGYATEGVSLTLARAFEDLGLHRVEANVIPENKPSLAVVRRCAMRREGYSPRYLQIAGTWRDHERWAITREDWQEIQQNL